MKTIHKFGISRRGISKISVPKNAYRLTADMQGQNIFIWMLIDCETTDREIQEYIVLATGEAVSIEALDHVSTIQEGPYVWHVFQIF
jgi:hypothetical protein